MGVTGRRDRACEGREGLGSKPAFQTAALHDGQQHGRLSPRSIDLVELYLLEPQNRKKF